MDFNKSRGGRGGSGSSRPGSSRRDTEFDANPDTISNRVLPDSSRPGSMDGPRSIHDTKVWQDSSAAGKKMWSNYTDMLKRNFRELSRAQQEQFINRICLITTMGVAALLLMFFYSFLPLFIRVFALPLILGGSYWAGNKVITPIMIIRYEQYLSKE